MTNKKKATKKVAKKTSQKKTSKKSAKKTTSKKTKSKKKSKEVLIEPRPSEVPKKKKTYNAKQKSKYQPHHNKVYNDTFPDLVFDFIHAGGLTKDFARKHRIHVGTFFDWCRIHPEFKEKYDLAKKTKGYLFKEEYHDELLLAVDMGLTVSKFSERIDVPISVVFAWEEYYENFNPSAVLKRTYSGRLSKYRPEYCDTIVELAEQGKTSSYFCSHVNIGRETMSRWIEAHGEFREAYKISKEKYQAYLEKLAEGHITGSHYDEKSENYQPWKSKGDGNFLRWNMERRLADYRPDAQLEIKQDIEAKIEEKPKLDLSQLSVEQLHQLKKILEVGESKKED